MIREPGARIAAILLRLAGVRVHEQLPDPAPELDVTQEDLASLANVSRATVSDHCARLESAGLISRAYGRVQLLDLKGLRALIG